MASKRKVKEERKEVTLEKRMDQLEKEMGKHNPITYNFLVGQIRQHNQFGQQQQKIADELGTFVKEQGLEQAFIDWYDKKNKKPEPEPGEEGCETCNGRGLIGDDEECPKCHPNKQ